MKICYIFSSAFPSKNASSLQTAKMADSLSNFSELYLFLPNTGLKDISVKKFYNLKNSINIIRLKKFKKFPVGIDHYFFALKSIFESIRFNPDYYITRMFIVSVFLTLFKKKHILEIHNDMNLEGRIVKILFKYLNFFNSKYIVKIVTTTRSLKKHYILNYNIPEKKIIIIPNGSSFVRDPKNLVKSKIKNVGYFGSLNQSRGLSRIIFLAQKFRNLNFFIYGGEKLEVEKLKRKFRKKNLFFNCYIDQYKIEIIMKKMDILLLPYTDKITVAGDVGNMFDFTSPLKMFDYLATGKIIISSDIKVLNEILVDKRNCFFIKNYLNNFAWELKFREVLSYKTKNKIISMNALKQSNIFSTRERAKKFLSILKN